MLYSGFTRALGDWMCKVKVAARKWLPGMDARHLKVKLNAYPIETLVTVAWLIVSKQFWFVFALCPFFRFGLMLCVNMFQHKFVPSQRAGHVVPPVGMPCAEDMRRSAVQLWSVFVIWLCLLGRASFQASIEEAVPSPKLITLQISGLEEKGLIAWCSSWFCM